MVFDAADKHQSSSDFILRAGDLDQAALFLVPTERWCTSLTYNKNLCSYTHHMALALFHTNLKYLFPGQVFLPRHSTVTLAQRSHKIIFPTWKANPHNQVLLYISPMGWTPSLPVAWEDMQLTRPIHQTQGWLLTGQTPKEEQHRWIANLITLEALAAHSWSLSFPELLPLPQGCLAASTRISQHIPHPLLKILWGKAQPGASCLNDFNTLISLEAPDALHMQ